MFLILIDLEDISYNFYLLQKLHLQLYELIIFSPDLILVLEFY
jgi:hypothetical protein